MGTVTLGKLSTWKTAKFMALQADFNNLNWRFEDSITSLDGLISELRGFPNPKNDDYMDAISMIYDDRVQAIIPQTRSFRPPMLVDNPSMHSIPLTRYTGLTDEIPSPDDYDTGESNYQMLPVARFG